MLCRLRGRDCCKQKLIAIASTVRYITYSSPVPATYTVELLGLPLTELTALSKEEFLSLRSFVCWANRLSDQCWAIDKRKKYRNRLLHCSMIVENDDSLALRSVRRMRISSCQAGSAIIEEEVEQDLAPVTWLLYLPPPRQYSYNGPCSSQGRFWACIILFVLIISKVIILGDSGSVLSSFVLLSPAELKRPLQCRQDIPHEPICKQAVQQSVQSHYRRRLVRLITHNAWRFMLIHISIV